MSKIAIIGAGSWGTALGLAAERAGSSVVLWSRDQEVLDSLRADKSNILFMPGVAFASDIEVTENYADTFDAEALFVVIPSQVVRDVLVGMKEQGLPADKPIVLCSKGIEKSSLMMMHEIAAEILPDNPLAILSGPNFAKEVAQGLPAATALACKDIKLAEKIAAMISSPSFRPYMSDDIVGAEVGGAVKNVIAIACGIIAGRELGENAKAALITRGMAELTRLCTAKGGEAKTMLGLSGMGDLVLTCSSELSRNMSLGLALGKGASLQEVMADRIQVTEGVASSESVTALAKKLEISMPICESVYDILYQGADIDNTIQTLMERPLTFDT